MLYKIWRASSSSRTLPAYYHKNHVVEDVYTSLSMLPLSILEFYCYLEHTHCYTNEGIIPFSKFNF